MSNFLETLTLPQLGSADFQTEFEAFCSAIKNNFERLVSVQFTKGNDGNSVVTQHILIGAGLTKTDTMPNLVYQIVKSIYKFDVDTMTIGEFKHALEGDHNIFGDTTSGGIAPSFYDAYSFPELQDLSNETQTTTGFYVDIVIDEHNKKAYTAVPYIFIDGRISELSRYKREHADKDIYKTFHDYSTSVFGMGTYEEPEEPTEDEIKIVDWNWETDSIDIVPKLYFDDNIGEFCWEVNRQRTGVTAQGVKGNDGIASHVYTAKGTLRGNNDIKIIEIDEIQYADDNGNISWLSNKERLDDIKNYINGEESVIRSVRFSDETNSVVLRDTDFLLVFYREQSNSSTYDKAFLGKPYVSAEEDSTDVFVYCDEYNDIYNSISKQNFRDMLNGIYNSDNIADLRGIYIPGRSQISETANTYHMTYSESSSKMHSAIVDYDGTQGNADSPITQQIGDWQIDYNTQVQGNTSIQGAMYVQGNATMRNDACVQGNLNVQGNIEAESIKVTGKPFRSIPDVRPAVICTFKNTSYKLTRNAEPLTTLRLGAISTQFGYDVELNTTLNIKVGMMSSTKYNDIDINTQIHKELGRYGVQSVDEYPSQFQYGPMWNTASVWQTSHITSKIQADVDEIIEQEKLYNAPKLYDVVEYDIPINISKSTGIIAKTEHVSGTTDNFTIEPINNVSAPIILKDGNDNNWNIGVSEGYTWTNFSDISYRILLKDGVLPKQPGYIEYHKSCLIDTDLFARNESAATFYNSKVIWGPLYMCLKKYNTHTVSKFDFNGSFDYKGETINYKLDFFIRVNEIINRYGDQEASSDWFGWTNKSNIQLTISPIGYLEYKNYKTPIFGSIPIGGVLPESNQPNFNQPIMYGIVNDSTEVMTNVYYERLTPYYQQQIFSNSIPKSTTFLSIFEKEGSEVQYVENPATANGRTSWHKPELSFFSNLEGNYTNLTQTMKVVDENLKVCPNNMDDGTWKHDNQGYYWIADNLLYPMVFSQDCYPSGEPQQEWFVGIFDPLHPITVNGILTYPYGPALLSYCDDEDADEYGQYYEDKYDDEHPFYHKQGKILGNTNSTTKGMVFVEDTTEP